MCVREAMPWLDAAHRGLYQMGRFLQQVIIVCRPDPPWVRLKQRDDVAVQGIGVRDKKSIARNGGQRRGKGPGERIGALVLVDAAANVGDDRQIGLERLPYEADVVLWREPSCRRRSIPPLPGLDDAIDKRGPYRQPRGAGETGADDGCYFRCPDG